MQKNHIPRKRFGQHFLIDENVLRKIVEAVAPQKTDHLVEIGPGLGALTKMILPIVDEMDGVELDRDLIPKLAKMSENLGRLHLHQADALKFDFTSLFRNGLRLRIIGNLPYNISTPVIFHLLSQMHVIQDMHFMLQKEVVERLSATVGNHQYGRLSIMVQYHCQVELLFIVKPQSFRPAPQVESALVRLIPHRHLPFVAEDYAAFALVVKQAFGQRRKMIHTSLKNFISSEQLKQLHIDPQLRPEQLSVEDFVRISNTIRH